MINLVRRAAPSPQTLKLFVFVGIVWAAIVGPLSSVVILNSIGATSQQIGIFSAICAVISMVFQPFWGYLSDKIGSPRRVLCLCLGATAVFFGLVLLTGNFYVAAGLFFLDTAFRCCIIPLLDSHILSEVNAMPGMQYSYIRMAGAIFFGTVSLIYSGIISASGVMAIVPISSCIAALAVLWGLFAAKGQAEISRGRGGVHIVRPNLKKDAVFLLRNRQYIMFLVLVSLWSLATMPLYTFIIDYVTAVGGHPGQVSMIHAFRCVAELPFFILVGTVGRRIEAKKLMFAGMLCSVLHMAGLYFATTFSWLIVSNFFAGPAFILGLTGRMRYVSEAAPESVRSTSITLMGACEVGLGSIVGNLIAGFVSGTYGTQAVSLVALAAICASMVMLIFCVNQRSNQPT